VTKACARDASCPIAVVNPDVGIDEVRRH
jgi:hypothetical protein